MSVKRIGIFREIAIVLVLSLVLVSALSIKAVNAQAGQVTLKPTDDSYVDSDSPDSNYGGQEALQIGNYQVLGHTECIGWLKFDLSTLPSGAVVDNATLQLHTQTVGETYNVCACYCSDNSWTDLGITWNNYPRVGFISVDSATVATSESWYSWNVSGAVKYTQLNNLTAMTIALIEPNIHSSAAFFWFDSTRNSVYRTDYAPNLTVHWGSVAPEFSMFLILPSFMMATLLAVMVCKKKPCSTKSPSQAERGTSVSVCLSVCF